MDWEQEEGKKRKKKKKKKKFCRFYPCLLNGPSSTLALLTARTMQAARERCFFCKVGRPARERRRKRGEQREGRRSWALDGQRLRAKKTHRVSRPSCLSPQAFRPD